MAHVIVEPDFWTSESDRFYNITLVRPSVRSSVRNAIDLGNSSKDFSELGMKLGNNKGKKIARPDFEKSLILAKFGLTCEKWPFLAKISAFGTLQKKRLQQIF